MNIGEEVQGKTIKMLPFCGWYYSANEYRIRAKRDVECNEHSF